MHKERICSPVGLFCGGGGGGGACQFQGSAMNQPQGRTRDFRRGGGVPRGRGGGPRSAKEANKPNKRATELKPRPCAHQGSMFRPY